MEKDYFHIEGTDKYMRGIDAPLDFWECGEHEKQAEIIKKNIRAILQLLGIKVLVYPDHVEIKGTIPSHFYIRERNRSQTLVWLYLPLPINRGNSKFLESGFAPL